MTDQGKRENKDEQREANRKVKRQRGSLRKAPSENGGWRAEQRNSERHLYTL